MTLEEVKTELQDTCNKSKVLMQQAHNTSQDYLNYSTAYTNVLEKLMQLAIYEKQMSAPTGGCGCGCSS